MTGEIRWRFPTYNCLHRPRCGAEAEGEPGSGLCEEWHCVKSLEPLRKSLKLCSCPCPLKSYFRKCLVCLLFGKMASFVSKDPGRLLWSRQIGRRLWEAGISNCTHFQSRKETFWALIRNNFSVNRKSSLWSSHNRKFGYTKGLEDLGIDFAKTPYWLFLKRQREKITKPVTLQNKTKSEKPAKLKSEEKRILNCSDCELRTS